MPWCFSLSTRSNIRSRVCKSIGWGIFISQPLNVRRLPFVQHRIPKISFLAQETLFRQGLLMRSSTGFLIAAILLSSLVSNGLVAQGIQVRVPSRDELASAPQKITLRAYVRVPDSMTSKAAVDLWSDSAMLSLAGVPSQFELFLNGTRIGGGPKLPHAPRQRFKIPRGVLERQAFNCIALQFEGSITQGGLEVAPAVHGYHDELLMEGTWELLPGFVAPTELRAMSVRPAGAVFTEQGFKESSLPLARTTNLVRGHQSSSRESLSMATVAEGLAVDVLLAEPDVAQPTHFSYDASGRLWVAQYKQYPYPAGIKMLSRDKYYRATFDKLPPAPPYHDRGADIISVHEDTDGDGTYDRSRNVISGLNMANGVIHGRGGIWVMHTPYLLFYPDPDGDGVPDGDPETVLAGFGLEDTHSVANGLAWGPDGWLYGAQGSTTTSRVRRPGLDSADSPGVYYESVMTWRYHPVRRTYEIFSEGGGNSFGLEFDSEGRLFSGHNGGETRGWHFVQNGVYLKQGKDPGKFGPPSNPYAFGEKNFMQSSNRISRFSHHFAVYEGTGLPVAYQGMLFSADPLHFQIILSQRHPLGSSFTTSDTGIALEIKDRVFRPVYVMGAPDGSIHVADFCEEYIAHGQHYQGQIDPDSGRIYRIRGRGMPLEKDVNLAAKDSSQLVALLSHPNKWHRQTAVRLLAERRDVSTRPMLETLLRARRTSSSNSAHPALESLWALHQAGWLDPSNGWLALHHPISVVRAWGVRLLGDSGVFAEPIWPIVQSLVSNEPSAEVRCQIASTSRKLPSKQALPLVLTLTRRDLDADDPFTPLLCWLVVESFLRTERDVVLRHFGFEQDGLGPGPAMWTSRMGMESLLSKMMRRSAATGVRADLQLCQRLLSSAPGETQRRALAKVMEDGLRGRDLSGIPEELYSALASSGGELPLLGIRRRDPQAVRKALEQVADVRLGVRERSTLIQALAEWEDPTVVKTLLDRAEADPDHEVRRAALTAVSRQADPSIAQRVLAMLGKLPSDVRATGLTTLVSRPAWALEMLKSVESGVISAATLTPDLVERLRAYPGAEIVSVVQRLFPLARRASSPEIQTRIQAIRRILGENPGNPYAGEALYNNRCASCHQLFHKGGKVGPNLTPYQREDLGTLLPSLLDPSIEIREGFVQTLIETRDGRSLSGVVVDQDSTVVVVRAADGQDTTIRREEIQELRHSQLSLMPEGLLDGLSEQQLRDFFAYLRIPQPISR